VYINLEVKEYITPKVIKSKLTQLSKKVQSTLIVIKYNDIISYKFKAVKFIVWIRVSKDITK